ncbi:MAG: hypothetical protein GY769_09480 [bacterium]|nr:hypothetical protein [bacterium]
MGNGYEAAQEQRNWLERLGARIPGFKGYQDRELRRDVDRMPREHISREFGGLKGSVRTRARDYTDAGQIGLLHLFDRLDRKLDGLSQSIRFADYGASGLFDVVKILDAELEKLYEFDLTFLDDVAALKGDIDSIPAPGDGDVQGTVGDVQSRLEAMEGRWNERKVLIGNVVESSS